MRRSDGRTNHQHETELHSCRGFSAWIPRILTGQQPVVLLQFKAVEDPLDMLKLLLLLLLQLFLQGSAAFLLLLFLIQWLSWKETHKVYTTDTDRVLHFCADFASVAPPPHQVVDQLLTISAFSSMALIWAFSLLTSRS